MHIRGTYMHTHTCVRTYVGTYIQTDRRTETDRQTDRQTDRLPSVVRFSKDTDVDMHIVISLDMQT